ncbi:hypothetical protein D3C87_1576220 [compost metagenome]
MPNKETSKSHSKSQKPALKKMKAVETGEFEISGSEHLGEDTEESDFEITGRESLIAKKDDKHKKSKH